MSNRLESLEVTNDTIFKGNVYGTSIELSSVEFSDYITNGELTIIDSTISNTINEDIEILTNNSIGTENAGNINLNVGEATGTGNNGNLNFIVGGVIYQWPTTGPTTNGQQLTVISGGGTSNVTLGWA